MEKIIKTVHADLELQARDRYHRVPFTLPEGSESVGVRIAVTPESAVIDLGCQGPSGWRGWSGGARREFVIGPDAATPGYVPGVLESGTWAVILGLHNLPTGSADVTVEITVPSQVPIPPAGPTPPPPDGAIPRGSARDLPAPAGLRWFAGDFHNHTTHSDGDRSIEEVAALGASLGLDFMAITDHNTVSHHPLLPAIGLAYDITLIPGQEVTTHRGHANAFGDIGWIDFREHPDRWIEETATRNGILSVNHPIDGDCSWTETLLRRPHAVELWHASWYRDLYSTAPHSWLAGRNREVTLIGGSDFHRPDLPNRPGTPVTWVAAEDRTVEAILDALRLRRTTITGAVDYRDGVITPRVQDCPILLRQDNDSMIAVAAAGTTLVDFNGNRRLLNSSYEVLDAPVEYGPYSLVLPDRMIVALSR